MLDGTYFNGWCVLIAFTGTHVLDWQWCDQEKKIAWQTLMKRIPAPRVAIVDGGTGLHAALREDWPETRVQRCFFHVFQTTRRHLTFAPRLPAGRELMALTKALMRVQDLDQGRAWLSAYSQWEAKWDEFLKHRTYASAGGERPSMIAPTRSWWFTHDRLRRARALYRQLIRNQNLFVWLDPDLKPADGSKIHRTTSPLEGGPNKAIKDLLRTRAHSGGLALEFFDRNPGGSLDPRPGRALEPAKENHYPRNGTRGARNLRDSIQLGRRQRYPARLGRKKPPMTRPARTHFSAYNPIWAAKIASDEHKDAPALRRRQMVFNSFVFFRSMVRLRHLWWS